MRRGARLPSPDPLSTLSLSRVHTHTRTRTGHTMHGLSVALDHERPHTAASTRTSWAGQLRPEQQLSPVTAFQVRGQVQVHVRAAACAQVHAVAPCRLASSLVLLHRRLVLCPLLLGRLALLLVLGCKHRRCADLHATAEERAAGMAACKTFEFNHWPLPAPPPPLLPTRHSPLSACRPLLALAPQR